MQSFGIHSFRIVDSVHNEKKYVAYLLHVNRDLINPEPIQVERRYTHFLELYNGLKKDFPVLLNTLAFPRKIMMGNFENGLIEERKTAFNKLINLLSEESRLREHPAAVKFFQEPELLEARKCIQNGEFDKALNLLENIFKLLNKIYTDRSRVVLCALCRIVAVSGVSGGTVAASVERWAQLALRRYEAVSDTDLLLVYIPLLHACISIWETLELDTSKLVEELSSLRKRGMKVDSVPSLMEAVDSLSDTT